MVAWAVEKGDRATLLAGWLRSPELAAFAVFVASAVDVHEITDPDARTCIVR